MKEFYESGTLKQEAPFKNDKVEGLAKGYYESGALMEESTLKNNKLEGLVKKYYESGAIHWEIPFKNGKRDGLKKGYCKNGIKASTAKYTKGILQGYVQCADGTKGDEQIQCKCND